MTDIYVSKVVKNVFVYELLMLGLREHSFYILEGWGVKDFMHFWWESVGLKHHRVKAQDKETYKTFTLKVRFLFETYMGTGSDLFVIVVSQFLVLS